jgi:hypothetical protein
VDVIDLVQCFAVHNHAMVAALKFWCLLVPWQIKIDQPDNRIGGFQTDGNGEAAIRAEVAALCVFPVHERRDRIDHKREQAP